MSAATKKSPLKLPTPSEITSAYLHIPFCSHKCDFCDFAAFAGLDHLEDAYADVVVKEIAERLSHSKTHQLSSVFYGGGTPGLMAPSNLRKIHEALRQHTNLDTDCETSLETTPHAITAEKLKSWSQLGINRLSIGIESLDDDELTAMGRDHTRSQAFDGIQKALDSSITNVSIDLMYGLPTQTKESWTRTLSDVIALSKHPSIKHVSAYGLHLASNSPLYSRFPRGSPQFPNDDQFCDMFDQLVETLTNNGFTHYEVSNFAKPGFESRHNLGYWQNHEYLGFGVSAHRYIDGVRSSNWRSLKKYMNDPRGSETSELIDEQTRIKEAIMLGLRMRKGINLADFKRDYGIDLELEFSAQVAKLTAGGLLTKTGGHLAISHQAVVLSNDVIVEFM